MSKTTPFFKNPNAINHETLTQPILEPLDSLDPLGRPPSKGINRPRRFRHALNGSHPDLAFFLEQTLVFLEKVSREQKFLKSIDVEEIKDGKSFFSQIDQNLTEISKRKKILKNLLEKSFPPNDSWDPLRFSILAIHFHLDQIFEDSKGLKQEIFPVPPEIEETKCKPLRPTKSQNLLHPNLPKVAIETLPSPYKKPAGKLLILLCLLLLIPIAYFVSVAFLDGTNNEKILIELGIMI